MSRIPSAFSCPKEFLAMVDQRAASLGMTRSAYIVQVLRQDIMTGKPNLSIISHHAVINGNIINQNNTNVISAKKKRRINEARSLKK
jgi:hypothetical protein